MSLNASAEADSDQSSSSTISDPPEFSLAERLQLALEAHQTQVKHVSIRKTARMYGVPRSMGNGFGQLDSTSSGLGMAGTCRSSP